MKKLVSAIIATALTFMVPAMFMLYLSISEAKAATINKEKSGNVDDNAEDSFKPGKMYILKG